MSRYFPYAKWNPTKDYFPLPNELFSLGLTSGEIAVYSYLMYRENRKTYQCHPSYKTIGRALRMSTNTVRKYVTSLEDKHLIHTENTTVTTHSGLRHNGCLKYTILPIDEAKTHFVERQLSLDHL